MHESPHQDDPLRKLLKEWRTDASLPPRFQETVWRRIELANRKSGVSGIETIAHWFTWAFARRSVAALYVALLVLVGSSIGWTQARQATLRVKGELAERYVRLLDPYQSPRR